LIEMYEHGERAMSDDEFLEQGIIGADPEHHVERIRSRAARRASGAGPDAIAISRAVRDQRSEARERRARSAGARDDSRARLACGNERCAAARASNVAEWPL
jgi:hypothetical protein